MNTQKSQFSENTSYEMDFDQPAINIGTHPDNDITLTGDGVFPFHVSLIVQDGECQILALDADAEVRLDGERVEAAQFKLAGVARRLDIGANQLLLEYNKTFDSLHVRINPAFSNAFSESKRKDPVNKVAFPALPVGDSAILLNVFSQTDEVEVGQTSTYELEIVNAGALVASFTVFVEGVPTEWLSISPGEINLYEGQHKRVQINITPPRQPTSTAGQHDLRVSVFSENYPGHQAVAPITLRIKPYYEFTLGNLSPREQHIYHLPKSKRLGNTVLPITNLGNCPADFGLSTTDDENACAFDFVLDDGTRLNRQATLQIAAGQTLLQPIEITPRKRRWVTGKRYSHTTAVKIANQSVSSQMVGGSLNSHPFLHLWVIAAMILTLAVIAFIVLQPGIIDFQADKAIVEPKDNTIKLTWSLARFTDRVNISGNTQPLNNGQPFINGQTSFTVTPSQTTTYEIVAGNWLSGLLHSDVREILTVVVVPPSPTINDFSVDNSQVAPGKEVKISWSVTQADQVTLTVGDSVEVLKDLKGERSVPMKADTLVALEAKNAGGQALRSRFVHVKQPEIVVNKFVVLVHPQTTAFVENGTAKRVALSQVSDTDEWVEYVKLIPDSDQASDNDYKAIFVDDRELDKGEPVMVQWEVTGTDNDKIQIATDTKDELPAKSSKPAFPDKSTNYVLTATSGELIKIYTLPIKVFNGSPPTAPTIEFFQAVPMAILGKGEVKFSWSVAGEWTRIELINSEGTVANINNPQGFKTVIASQSDTYILTAWNGTLSSSETLNITVNPSLLKIGLQIDSASPYPETDRFWVGDKVAVSVKFDTAQSGKPDPTGSVIITDGSSSCSFTLPINTCELYFKTAGEKQLIASYGGDTIYVQGKSPYYPPNNKKMVVSSPGMVLSAKFYIPDSAGNPDQLIDLPNQVFEITQKLLAEIKFKPSAGRALDDDDTGNQISYSICKLDQCSDQIPANSITIDNGIGTAKILIPGFPGAGANYELRFYYNHSEHLFASTSISRSGFTVSKLGIYLTLPPSSACVSTSGITDNAICSFSYIDPTQAQIAFDIHQTIGRDYLDASMAQPIFGDTIWNFTVDSARVPCTVKTKTLSTSTRSVYFLDCIANVANKVVLSANYTYNNTVALDYIMGNAPKSFSLRPTRQTTLAFDKNNYSVGTVIPLTPGKNLHLMDAQTDIEITQTAGEIIISNPKKEDDLFGVVPGSTCKVNSTGDGITDIYVSSPCQIFFRKAGTWDMQINFKGDDNNAASVRKITGINVVKQNQITATWYYSDSSGTNPTKKWDDVATITISRNATPPYSMKGRIVFAGPSTFSANALDGVELSLQMENNPFCAFNPPTGSPKIIFNQQAGLDFSVVCQNTPAKSNLKITFPDPNVSKNFGFILANDTTRQVVFAENISYGGVYFEFEDKNNKPSSFKFDWNDRPRSDKEIKSVLYAGEPYLIHLMYQPIWIDPSKLGTSPSVSGCTNKPDNLCSTLNDLLDFIQYGKYINYRAINIAIPPSWMDKVNINKVSGLCSVDNSNGKIVVPLVFRRYFDHASSSWNYVELSSPAMKDDSNVSNHSYQFDDSKNPCIVTFTYNTGIVRKALGKDEAVTFSLSDDFTEPTVKVNNLGIFYSASENYKVGGGLAKVFVNPTFNPPPPNPNAPLILFNTKTTADSPKQTVVMTFDKSKTDEAPILDNNLYKWFRVNFPPSCVGGSLVGTIDPINNNVVTWVMTPPPSPCTGHLSIDYIENTFFGQTRLVSQQVQFTSPSAP